MSVSTMATATMLINGELVEAQGGETFAVLNPFDGSEVGRAPRGRDTDIDKAVKAAREAFDNGSWRSMDGETRKNHIEAIADLLEANKRELGSIMIQESGSTLRKAKGEVYMSIKQLRYFASLATTPMEEPIEALTKPGVSRNWLVREPIGVCGQIIPWNFPLSMLVWKLGPALAAGNTVVLKPAEETPLLALRVGQLIAESDLPPGVVNIVSGYGEEAGAPLVAHPQVDKIAFTGSTEIGKKIMAEAATTMKRVTLECGGKSANIVLDDADFEEALAGSLYAAFFHSGQCCEAGTRLFVHRGIYDKFVDAFVEKMGQMQLGDPSDMATDMGPLVSKKQQERVLKYIALGEKEGGKVRIGGAAPTDPALQQGCFVQPTLLIDVENSMQVAQEEIFGPVIVVMPFDTVDEVVSLANQSHYGLGGAVWSQDESKAMDIAKRLRTGTVWVNEYHLISEKAPFGGFKQSGLGREMGLEGLKAYTEVKHIHVDELRDVNKKAWYGSVLAPKE